MKKSTIIIIVLVYLASIVIINFFGMAIFSYNTKIYAESVVCINQDMNLNSEGIKQANLSWKDGLTYRIEHKIYPEDVTVKTVSYIYDTNNQYITIDDDGFVRFIKKPPRKINSFSISLKTNDGTNIETPILLVVVT